VFGSFAYTNQRTSTYGEHSYAHASVLYDVLNRIALDAVLAPSHSYEVELAAEHLAHTEANDLVIYDRGYCSFRMLALASMAKGHFLVRCTSRSFKIAPTMLSGEGPDDVTVELIPSQKFLLNSDNQQPRRKQRGMYVVSCLSPDSQLQVFRVMPLILDVAFYDTPVATRTYRGGVIAI
jgi:hypothetical protein